MPFGEASNNLFNCADDMALLLAFGPPASASAESNPVVTGEAGSSEALFGGAQQTAVTGGFSTDAFCEDCVQAADACDFCGPADFLF